MSALNFDPWAVLKCQRADAALAEAAAHFAKAQAHWRDLRFMLEIEDERRREDLVSEAPVEVWLRPGPTWDSYSTTAFPDQPDAVRYVRAGHERGRERAMSEAPTELWVSPGEGEYAGLWVEDGPGVLDEVRYVLAAYMRDVVRGALEALEDDDEACAVAILRTALEPLKPTGEADYR